MLYPLLWLKGKDTVVPVLN